MSFPLIRAFSMSMSRWWRVHPLSRITCNAEPGRSDAPEWAAAAARRCVLSAVASMSRGVRVEVHQVAVWRGDQEPAPSA